MEIVKNYQVPLIESNMVLLKQMTGETVSKAAIEKSVEWTLNRRSRMEVALQAARDYISVKNIGSSGAEAIIKQIDEALL